MKLPLRVFFFTLLNVSNKLFIIYNIVHLYELFCVCRINCKGLFNLVLLIFLFYPLTFQVISELQIAFAQLFTIYPEKKMATRRGKRKLFPIIAAELYGQGFPRHLVRVVNAHRKCPHFRGAQVFRWVRLFRGNVVVL